jgi:hypothetical protein
MAVGWKDGMARGGGRVRGGGGNKGVCAIHSTILHHIRTVIPGSGTSNREKEGVRGEKGLAEEGGDDEKNKQVGWNGGGAVEGLKIGRGWTWERGEGHGRGGEGQGGKGERSKERRRKAQQDRVVVQGSQRGKEEGGKKTERMKEDGIKE